MAQSYVSTFEELSWEISLLFPIWSAKKQPQKRYIKAMNSAPEQLWTPVTTENITKALKKNQITGKQLGMIKAPTSGQNI